jgi:hypothetical protein
MYWPIGRREPVHPAVDSVVITNTYKWKSDVWNHHPSAIKADSDTYRIMKLNLKLAMKDKWLQVNSILVDFIATQDVVIKIKSYGIINKIFSRNIYFFLPNIE